MIIHICHLCQCQEMFKGTLTFIYDKVISISMILCQDCLFLCQCLSSSSMKVAIINVKIWHWPSVKVGNDKFNIILL